MMPWSSCATRMRVAVAAAAASRQSLHHCNRAVIVQQINNTTRRLRTNPTIHVSMLRRGVFLLPANVHRRTITTTSSEARPKFTSRAQFNQRQVELMQPILHLAREKDWENMFQKILVAEQDDLGLLAISSTALSHLAKIPALPKDHPHLLSMLDRIANHMEAASSSSIDPYSYAKIVRSIAIMKAPSGSTLRIVNHLVCPIFCLDFMTNGNTIDVSMVAWGLAELQRKDLMKVLLPNQMTEQAVVDKLFDGPPSYVSVTALASAKLGHSPPALFDAIEQRGDSLVNSGCKPHVVANIAWACATLGRSSPALFAAIAKRSDWLVTTGSAHQVATTVWACATLGHASPDLFAALDRHIDKLGASSGIGHLVQVVQACEKLGHSSTALLEALQKRSEWVVANGIFKDISTSSSPSLLAAVDKRGDASLQAVAEMAWACAALGHTSPILFDAIDKHSDWIVRHGARRDVHRIADACRRLGHETPFQLLSAAKKEEPQQRGEKGKLPVVVGPAATGRRRKKKNPTQRGIQHPS